ncbi:DNA repair protein RadA [Candidatus Roizmanbacteria bacterium RIFCSPHIGHO2_02_FULL_37_13b]|uniref:DNA repair protein RadA n=1 Tax=Candidatus Roizmanbacteria bacterium RIFCSPLOWO2_02_FULL_36_11 TaxID=1802071 RepID=A0A1F7JCL0_9BACT|nr:MAG: DNA repair protein RadA [Candidatus Roizmanbacteria bacterium RIFCSPHIGHO2_02_FULL_37_13b]OGK53339.1 MAG: DNA repair protein RadA [Candidatus Roizmanbacteria bacterium RIFCSPLOWO2_02_FULL_36_11]
MTSFVCASCGYNASSWYGRCPECHSWDSFKKFAEEKKRSIEPAKIVAFTDISRASKQRLSTGIFEVDRVLGGGVVSGEVILLAGEPGIGKSTLLLAACQNLSCLYIAGEESATQVKERAQRIKATSKRLYISENTQIDAIIQAIMKTTHKFDLVVIDSIQTVRSSNLSNPSGSISQVKEVADKLIDYAKKNDIAMILVGHVTKEGDVAGPRTLEHLVDCVLYFEGETSSEYRILRAKKNRFGTTGEVGVFQMTGAGLKEVNSATAFIDDISVSPGKVIVGIVEGQRSLFYEIQSLVNASFLPVPRRVVAGLDYNRVQLILAVIRKNLRISLEKHDVYCSVAGGLTVKSPVADLGIAASIISSFKNRALPPKSVFVGEVGLLGEIRKSNYDSKLIAEAKRHGFKSIFTNKETPKISSLNSFFT